MEEKSEKVKQTNIAPEETVPEPKKSHKGVIIGLILALLIAAVGIVAVILLSRSSNPEAVALDAITRTIKEENKTISGTVKISSSETGSVTLALDGKSSGLNNEASATITVKMNNLGDFVFRFNEVFQDNGTLYLKTSELRDFFDSVKDKYKAYLTTDALTAVVDSIDNLVKSVDARWWRISVAEIMELSGLSSESLATEYNCVIKAAGDIFKSSGLNHLAEIYQNNQFLIVGASDVKPASFTGNSYSAAIDSVRLAKFWNTFVVSEDVAAIRACGENSDILETVMPDELVGTATFATYLDIDNNHNLNGFYLRAVSDSNITTEVDLRLGKGDGRIETPETSKPITDLKDEVENVAKSIVNLFSFATAE